MKDMTSVATTMMTEEEKAEIERQMNSNNPKVNGGPSTPAAVDHGAPTPQGPSATTTSPSSPSELHPANGATAEKPSADVHPPTASSSSNALNHSPNGPSPASPAASLAAEREQKEQEKREAARRKAEQREKLKEHDRQRRKAMEERVAMLTQKMIERLRPFVEAKDPGGKDDPESKAFADKMKREVEDLKLESFGVEVSVLHANGHPFVDIVSLQIFISSFIRLAAYIS